METDHGRLNGSTIGPDGIARPAILGPALDGSKPGVIGRLADASGAAVRAAGPLQFVPETWKRWGAGNVQDIDNAARAAARYLCADGHDLSTPAGRRAAALAYNNVGWYATDVLAVYADYLARRPAHSFPVKPGAGDPAPGVSREGRRGEAVRISRSPARRRPRRRPGRQLRRRLRPAPRPSVKPRRRLLGPRRPAPRRARRRRSRPRRPARPRRRRCRRAGIDQPDAHGSGRRSSTLRSSTRARPGMPLERMFAFLPVVGRELARQSGEGPRRVDRSVPRGVADVIEHGRRDGQRAGHRAAVRRGAPCCGQSINDGAVTSHHEPCGRTMVWCVCPLSQSTTLGWPAITCSN